MPQQLPIKDAQAAALKRWQTPFRGFTSGHDPRTSDNALLTLIYGGLVLAADHEWLNAGRRLIDKTYIEMLWQVQALDSMRTCRAEQVSAALDGFIQGTIRRQWETLPTLNSDEKLLLAEEWVSEISETCFGSLRSELAASRLLFFLCPMLPVFNLSRGHLLALEQLGYPCPEDSYWAYARSAASALQELAPMLGSLPQPIAEFGDPSQQILIQHLLDDSDWWPRRVFDQLLHQFLSPTPVTAPNLFACDDAGQLLSAAQ